MGFQSGPAYARQLHHQCLNIFINDSMTSLTQVVSSVAAKQDLSGLWETAHMFQFRGVSTSMADIDSLRCYLSHEFPERQAYFT
jgi:hypothetical protein